MGSKTKSLADHLAVVPDPRKIRGQRHILLDIILIAILGTLSGVDDWEGIEVFAEEQESLTQNPENASDQTQAEPAPLPAQRFERGPFTPQPWRRFVRIA